MGQIQENTGFGRVHSADGWVIEAWCGNGAGPSHTAYRFGALNQTTIAAFGDACEDAYTSGEAAWLTACGSGFETWYNGLTSARKTLVFEAARKAGEMGWGP